MWNQILNKLTHGASQFYQQIHIYIQTRNDVILTVIWITLFQIYLPILEKNLERKGRIGARNKDSWNVTMKLLESHLSNPYLTQVCSFFFPWYYIKLKLHPYLKRKGREWREAESIRKLLSMCKRYITDLQMKVNFIFSYLLPASHLHQRCSDGILRIPAAYVS